MSACALPDPQQPVDWSMFSILLLRPICIEQNLTKSILAELEPKLLILQHQTVTATEDQVLAHFGTQTPSAPDQPYPAAIRDTLVHAYAERPFGVLLVTPFELSTREDAATQIRSLIDNFGRAAAPQNAKRATADPSSSADTVSLVSFPQDCLGSSETSARAEYEFGIWLAPLGIEIWTPAPA